MAYKSQEEALVERLEQFFETIQQDLDEEGCGVCFTPVKLEVWDELGPTPEPLPSTMEF